jgi:hypothetical protein
LRNSIGIDIWSSSLSGHNIRHFMRTYMICIMSRNILDTQLGLTLNWYPKSWIPRLSRNFIKTNASLKEKLYAGTGDICPETFKEDDKVKHYTGLCYKTLMALFIYLEPNITHTSRSSLTKFLIIETLTPKYLRNSIGIDIWSSSLSGHNIRHFMRTYMICIMSRNI